ARRSARTTDPGDRARRIYTALMAPGYAASHPEEMAQIMAMARFRPMTRTAYYRQLWAVLRHTVVARLAMITVPTLVIHGANDPLIPMVHGQRLARGIRQARLIIYPDTGHIPIIE